MQRCISTAVRTSPLSTFFIGTMAFLLLSASGCVNRSFNKQVTSNTKNDRSVDAAKVEKIRSYVRMKYGSLRTEHDVPWFADTLYKPRGTLIPEDDASFARARGMLDRLWDAGIHAFPEMKELARPKLVAYDKSDWDGLHSSSNVCIVGFEVVLAGTATPPGALEPETYFDLSDGSFRSIADPSTGCTAQLDARVAPADANRLLQTHFKSKPNCTARVAGGRLELSPNCKEFSDFEQLKKRRVTNISLPSVGNTIVAYRGILEGVGANVMAAVLAHELSHYVRAHAFTSQLPPSPKQRYGFVFDVALAYRSPHIPEAATSQKAMELFDKLKNADWSSPGTHRATAFHPWIYSKIGRHFCGKLSEASKRLEPNRRNCAVLEEVFGRFPDAMEARLPPEVEKEVVSNVAGAFDAILKGVGDVPLQSLLSCEQGKFATCLDEDRRGVIVLKEGATLRSTVSEADSVLREQASQTKRLLAEAIEAKLGIYTYELEADQLAVAWLALAGFDPASVTNMAFVLGGQSELPGTTPRLTSPSVQDCRRAYLRGWKHGLNEKVDFVPQFGDVSGVTVGIHPGYCFRAYNADQELRALGIE